MACLLKYALFSRRWRPLRADAALPAQGQARGRREAFMREFDATTLAECAYPARPQTQPSGNRPVKTLRL
jgi:hypothetical protein